MISRLLLYAAVLLAARPQDLLQFPQKLILLLVIYSIILVFSLWNRPDWKDGAALGTLLVSIFLVIFQGFHYLPLLQVLVVIWISLDLFLDPGRSFSQLLILLGIMLSFSPYVLDLGRVHLEYSLAGYGLIFFSVFFTPDRNRYFLLQLVLALTMGVSFLGNTQLYFLFQFLVYLTLVFVVVWDAQSKRNRLSIVYILICAPLLLISLILSLWLPFPWLFIMDIILLLSRLVVLFYVQLSKGQQTSWDELRD